MSVERDVFRFNVSGATRTGLALLVVISIAVVLHVPWSPPNHKIHVDGTVFAYGGQRIIGGDLPYRDFWDHKPPAVFYLNALAFLAGPADAWTVWYLTVAWTVGVCVCAYWLLTRFLSRFHAALLTIVLIATLLQPGFYQGANLTEFYAVLPSLIALLLTYEYGSKRRAVYLVGVGAMLSLNALLKPTNIGTALACVLVLTLWQIRSAGVRYAAKGALLMLVPTVLMATVIAAAWTLQGALTDLWRATVEYNILYAGSGISLRSLYAALRKTATDPTLAPLLILSVGNMARFAWERWDESSVSPPAHTSGPPHSLLFGAAFLAIPIELGMIAAVGARFGHYFMPLIPPLVLGGAGLLSRTPTPVMEPESKSPYRNPGIFVAYASILIWFVAIFGLVRPSADDIRSFASDFPVQRPLRTDVGKYVQEMTNPEDSVLVWGLGAEISFETSRRAPTRYVYYLPLFVDGYHNA